MKSNQPTLSERVERVLALALDEADGLGHGFVTCQHLLYALSLESKGIASEVLVSLGVTPGAIHKLLSDADASHDRTAFATIDLSTEAHEVFERAVKQALEWGHSVVDTEHILYGIGKETTSADELLQSMRVTRGDLATQVDKVRASAPPPAVRDEAIHAYRLTLESAWLLSLASDFAKQFSNSRITTVHMLLAMLNLDGPLKTVLVDHFKLDATNLSSQLLKSGTANISGRIPLAEDLQILLGLAIGEAWNRGHLAVTPLHIAFSLGRGQSNAAREALADHGIAVSDLHEKLELIMPPPVI